MKYVSAIAISVILGFEIGILLMDAEA